MTLIRLCWCAVFYESSQGAYAILKKILCPAQILRAKLASKKRDQTTTMETYEPQSGNMCAQRRFNEVCALHGLIKKIKIFRVRIFDSQERKVDNGDSDKTARMRRLIWVYIGRICQSVGFYIVGLKWNDIKIKQNEKRTAVKGVHETVLLD